MRNSQSRAASPAPACATRDPVQRAPPPACAPRDPVQRVLGIPDGRVAPDSARCWRCGHPRFVCSAPNGYHYAARMAFNGQPTSSPTGCEDGTRRDDDLWRWWEPCDTFLTVRRRTPCEQCSPSFSVSCCAAPVRTYRLPRNPVQRGRGLPARLFLLQLLRRKTATSLGTGRSAASSSRVWTGRSTLRS